MGIQEIKNKYLGNDAGFTVVVDLAAMRSSAIEVLTEANRMVDNQKEREKRKNSGMLVNEDAEWTSRWKKRNVDSVKEQRRAIKTAQDMLADIVGILDKADAKLAEVK